MITEVIPLLLKEAALFLSGCDSTDQGLYGVAAEKSSRLPHVRRREELLVEGRASKTARAGSS
jgi:hypothetical protein